MGKLVDEIRGWQQNLQPAKAIPASTADRVSPAGDRVLAIACVDARINPKRFKKGGKPFAVGNGYIVRNIAARVLGPGGPDGDEEEKLLTEAIKSGVKCIRIIPHNHCGGIGACMCGKGGPRLKKYLGSLADVHEDALKFSDNDAKNLRCLEARSVLDSVNKLKLHKVVQEAFDAKKLRIEPYLLDTATGELMDPETALRDFSEHECKPPPHEPKMLIICNMDATLLPQDDLHTADGPLGDGKALIYRTQDGVVKGPASDKEAAMIEFALDGKVEDIVVLGKTGGHDSPEARAAQKDKIRHSVAALKRSYPETNSIQVRGWVIDPATQRIEEMDPATGRFSPMGLAAISR